MSSKTDIVRELVGADPAKLMQVFDSITRAVARSFEDDRQNSGIILLSGLNPSEAEIKRRTEICYDWFVRLRGDCSYSTRKALDYLPKALRTTLDGAIFEPPPATNSWGSRV